MDAYVGFVKSYMKTGLLGSKKIKQILTEVRGCAFFLLLSQLKFSNDLIKILICPH